MEKGRTYKDASSSAYQVISSILWNLNFHYVFTSAHQLSVFLVRQIHAMPSDHTSVKI